MNLHVSYANFNSLCLAYSACVKWVEKQNYKIFESIKPTYAQLSPKAKWISSFEQLYIFNILKNTYYDNKLTWRLMIPWGIKSLQWQRYLNGGLMIELSFHLSIQNMYTFINKTSNQSNDTTWYQ
jgi:hypothetical protein